MDWATAAFKLPNVIEQCMNLYSSTAPHVVAEEVRWRPTAGEAAGMTAKEAGSTDASHTILWQELYPEFSERLLPLLFADPAGKRFVLRDHYGKKDWLMQVVDENDETLCDVWIGVNPENGWEYDGLIRVGNANEEPYVWQVYQRYSDGSYKRLPSRFGTIEKALAA